MEAGRCTVTEWVMGCDWIMLPQHSFTHEDLSETWARKQGTRNNTKKCYIMSKANKHSFYSLDTILH